MKGSNVIETNYNCQLAVDNKTKLILSNDVITNAADYSEIKTQVETQEKTFN